MANRVVRGTARDSAGNAIASPIVTVFQTETLTLATIFSDIGGTPKPNPFTGDADGEWEFFVESSEVVKVKVEAPGFVVWEKDYISGGGVTDHADLDGLTTGDPHTQYDRTAVFDTRRYASVQAAVDAAKAAGGGTVLLQDDADLTSSLTVNGTNITFESRNGQSLIATASMAQILNITGATRIRFRGVTFVGGGFVTSQVVLVGGSSTDVLIEDCEVDGDGATAGVSLSSVANAVVRRCKIDDTLNCVRLSAASGSRVTVEDNDLRGWSNRGIWLNGSSTVRFTDVRLARNHIHSHNVAGTERRPIFFGGDETNPNLRGEIVGNRIVGNGAPFSGGNGVADMILLSGTEGFRIAENFCVDGGDNGIVVSQEASRGIVSGNTAERCHNTGILIGSTASIYTRDVTVTGNQCSNNGQSAGTAKFKAGIRLDKATDVLVDGNFCGDDQGTATQQYGLLVENSTRVRVGHNKFDGNNTSGFRNEGGNTDLEVAAIRSAYLAGHSNPAAGATKYGSPTISDTTVENATQVPAPFAGVARNLRVHQSNGPGAGETMTVTLRKNGANTALTVATTDESPDAFSDLVNEVSFAAGDNLNFSFVASNNGTYSGGHATASCELVKLAD